MIRVVQAKDPETICIWVSGSKLPVDIEMVLSPEQAFQLGADIIADACRATAAKQARERIKLRR